MRVEAGVPMTGRELDEHTIPHETGPWLIEQTVNFTKGYAFCSSDHAYTWARERRYMLCNRAPTPFEAGMQPYLPSRHMGGRVGLCDGHHTGPHEWKEAWPS